MHRCLRMKMGISSHRKKLNSLKIKIKKIKIKINTGTIWELSSYYTRRICYTQTHTCTYRARFQINPKGSLAVSSRCMRLRLTQHSLQAGTRLSSHGSAAPRICLRAVRFSRLTGGPSSPFLCYVGISRLSRHKLSTGKNQF